MKRRSGGVKEYMEEGEEVDDREEGKRSEKGVYGGKRGGGGKG